jgi:hypothetical protein
MAVELRCPDCRAKLRLPEDPEPGTEVECPECGSVFSAPDPETGEVPDARGKKKPAKRRPAEDDEDDDDRPKKAAEEKKKPSSKKGADKTPKKRKAKKKETNKVALVAVIVTGVVFAVTAIGLLVWFFTKKPPSYEMMTYLPADVSEASGVNLGHMQKYAEFIKVVEPTYKESGFQKAIEALAKALGGDARELPDYVVQGTGKTGSGLVIRTKKPFDPDDLKKLPGAQAGSKGGQTYYRISPIPNLWGGGLRVFAPTNRLVVFCPDSTTDGTFQKMIDGNKDDRDATLNGRVGALGRRITRGTFWAIVLFDTANRPKEDGAAAPGGGENVFKKDVVSSTQSAKGFGFKASLGSRSVRFEVDLWCGDEDAAKSLKDKYFGKDSQIIKAQDDASADPPKVWKGFANQLANQKVAADMFQNLGAKASGDLFIVYSECDTKLLMEVLSSLVGKITGQNSSGPAPMAAPGGNGGGPPKPMGPGGGAVPPL